MEQFSISYLHTKLFSQSQNTDVEKFSILYWQKCRFCQNLNTDREQFSILHCPTKLFCRNFPYRTVRQNCSAGERIQVEPFSMPVLVVKIGLPEMVVSEQNNVET